MALLVLAGGANAEWMFQNATDHLATRPLNASTVAWGDVDNDGDPDLFVGGGSNASVLYVNDGRHLADATEVYGLATLNTRYVYSAQFVDFDQDGYPDLFLLTDDAQGFRLFRQLSNRRFAAVATTVEITFLARIRSAAWVDVDGDGRLDLILSNGATQNSPPVVINNEDLELVENRGSGFLQVSAAVGAIAVEDYDRDGDADVFLGGSLSQRPRLMRKEATGYQDWAESFGLPPMAGLNGAVWFDYNNDQQFDLYTPGNAESNCLMRGTATLGTHGLVPVAGTPAVPPPDEGPRFAHAVDGNMDGWTDLFIVKPEMPGCKLFTNEQGNRWNDVTYDVGLNLAPPVTACAWADWDGDGDPDLALACGSNGVWLFQNNSDVAHEFIVVHPVSSANQALLQGCTVWMQFEQAKAVGSTYPCTSAPGGDFCGVLLVNSSNYKSGRGNLLVRWPNGLESQFTLSAASLGTTVTVVQPAPPEVERMPESEPAAPPRLTVSPNPFNPTTTLSYTLAEAADVELKVFNLMGQEVATLVSGPQAAGAHRISFNGASLPSGLYLSRFTAGGRSSVSRLMLAK
jgi:hypothetical protein